MAGQYIIKPDNRSLKVFQGIEEIPFTFPIAPLLEEARIQEILVDTTKETWQISLLLQNELSPEQTRELEEAVSSLTLGTSRVRLKIIYRKDLPPLAERIDCNWDKLVTAAGNKFPGINGWLNEAKYQLSGGKNLEILVRDKTGVEYLNRRREELAELFRDSILEDLNLSFGVGDFSEKIIEDQLRKEQEEASLQATVAKAQPVASKTSKPANNSNTIYGKKI